jgi:hypothetical protein
MAMSRGNRDDVLAGIAIAGIGAGAIGTAVISYPIGTAASMGPGYLPIALGVLLMLLGGLIALRASATGVAPPNPIGPVVRSVGMVLGAVLLFAGLITTLGVAVTGALTILGAALGSREVRIVETMLLAVFMAIVASLLFVKALGLPLKIWPY